MVWVPIQFRDTTASRGVTFYRKERQVLLLRVPTHVLASGRLWTRERNVNTGLNSQESIKIPPPVLLKLKSADPPPSATASSSPFFQQANYLAMELKRTVEIHGFWCSFPSPPPSKDLFVLNRCSWFALSYTHIGSFILFYWILLFFNLFKTPGENKHISDISPLNAGTLQNNAKQFRPHI